MRLRIDLAYDGTDFHGWAAQPGLRTVQGEIELALNVLLRDSSQGYRLTVGGRTDAGVHARGQVVHLDVAVDQVAMLSARRIEGVIKRNNVAGISIHSVQEVPDAFDARFGAVKRRYEYRLRGAGVKRDPLTARFTADVPKDLNISTMQYASDELLGLNDFTSFCKARDGATAVRELLSFEWRITDDGAFAARIEADAFCHSMVRALVGSVVAVGSGKLARGDLKRIRDARVRTNAFTVMPAHGLSLEEITYPPDDELVARTELTRARRDPIVLD